MQYDEFLSRVATDGGIGDRFHAEQATRATLEVLGQRLSGGENTDLSAQLPTELKGLLDAHTGDAEAFDVDDFLRRVADHEDRGCSAEEARNHARAVLGTVAEATSPDEIDNLRSQLPAGYAFLLESSP